MSPGVREIQSQCVHTRGDFLSLKCYFHFSMIYFLVFPCHSAPTATGLYLQVLTFSFFLSWSLIFCIFLESGNGNSPWLRILSPICHPSAVCVLDRTTHSHLGNFILAVPSAEKALAWISPWLIPSPPLSLCANITFSWSPSLVLLIPQNFVFFFFPQGISHLLECYILYLFLMCTASMLALLG